MKNYKILRIAGVHYLSALEGWLQENPEFNRYSYHEMQNTFFNSNILYSNGFSRSFNQFGQDAHEIIADFEVVQKQWAKENSIRYGSDNWMSDILMEQIKVMKPDIIYFQGTEWNIPGRFSPFKNVNLIKIIKNEYSFIKKVIAFSGYPSNIERINGADFLFCGSPRILNNYNKQGVDELMKSELLYHSFDEIILKRLEDNDKKYDFTFLGSARSPESRYYALLQLLAQTDLKAWINEQEIVKSNYSLKINIRDLIKGILKIFSPNHVKKLLEIKYLPNKIRNIFNELTKEKIAFKGVNRVNGSPALLKSNFPSRCQSPVMGLEMYSILGQSGLTFNKHADAAFGDVGNMRMFEATGVGTCLLTDTGHNMADLFGDGKEVVTYKTIDEAVEKVNYLLDHPYEAEEIAKAGQTRTLKDHTIMNRCQQIDEVIQKIL